MSWASAPRPQELSCSLAARGAHGAARKGSKEGGPPPACDPGGSIRSQGRGTPPGREALGQDSLGSRSNFLFCSVSRVQVTPWGGVVGVPWRNAWQPAPNCNSLFHCLVPCGPLCPSPASRCLAGQSTARLPQALMSPHPSQETSRCPGERPLLTGRSGPGAMVCVLCTDSPRVPLVPGPLGWGHTQDQGEGGVLG